MNMPGRLRVLQVAAEIFPLVKTGGLADVLAALPVALSDAGADVRLLLPGLPAIVDSVQGTRTLLDTGPCFGALRVRLLLARMPGFEARLVPEMTRAYERLETLVSPPPG